MTEILCDSNDFRAAAVAASVALLGERGIRDTDATDADFSYCLPTGAEAAEERRRLRRTGRIAMIVGIGGVAIGGLIAMWKKVTGFASEADETHWLIVAGCFSGTGFAAMLGQVFYVRRLTRRRVRERAGDLPGAISVSIENAATADQMKFMPEDSALLLIEPELGHIRLEGLAFRYLIRAEDTDSVLLQGGETGHTSAGVRINFHIGDVPLGIWVQEDAIGKQVWRGLTGKVTPLFERIRGCLLPQ